MTAGTEVRAGTTSMFDIAGAVVIVTGGSMGLGAAIADRLGEAGASVVITGRRREPLEAEAAALRSRGHAVLPVVADVAEPDDCERVVAETMERFGRVDGLVNNAGISGAAPATRETPEHFRRIIDINLAGTYWMAQACGRVMQPGSSIVNVSSILGLTSAGLPQAAYSASKAAVHGLTRDLAAQWSGRKGICVNAVAPGFFATDMTAEYDPAYVETQLARIPLGRWGDPAELAGTVMWLLSAAGGYVTGQTIVVDGGFTVV
jgi:NAD(P)-dependent dehydrogenase (short-subunit alcohol dehydrogenase family)